MADESSSQTAIRLLGEAFESRDVTMTEDDVYKAYQSPQYKPEIFFVKLKHESPASYLCDIAKKGKHSHAGKVSYMVNIKTWKVSQKCFSGKCQSHDGGRKVLVKPECVGMNAMSSSEEESGESGQE